MNDDDLSPTLGGGVREWPFVVSPRPMFAMPAPAIKASLKDRERSVFLRECRWRRDTMLDREEEHIATRERNVGEWELQRWMSR